MDFLLQDVKIPKTMKFKNEVKQAILNIMSLDIPPIAKVKAIKYLLESHSIIGGIKLAAGIAAGLDNSISTSAPKVQIEVEE